MEHLSPSFIEDWLNCPYKAIMTRKKGMNTSSKFTELGSVVHNTLERFFDDEAIFDDLEEIYDEEWAKANMIDYNLYAEGIKMLRNFQIGTVNNNSTILNREIKFELNLDEGEDVENPLIIKGRIDRIDYLENNTYEIIDYKTSFHAKDKWETEQDIQMAIYNLVFWRLWKTGIFFDVEKYPQPSEILLSIYYLRHGKWRVPSKTNEDMKSLENYIRVIWKQVLAHEDNPPQTINKYCMYCPFREECAAYRKVIDMIPDSFLLDDMTDDELVNYYEKVKLQATLLDKRADEVKLALKERLVVHDGIMETPDYRVTARVNKYKIRRVPDVRRLLAPLGPDAFDSVISINNKRLDALAKNEDIEDLVERITTFNFSEPIIDIKPNLE